MGRSLVLSLCHGCGSDISPRFNSAASRTIAAGRRSHNSAGAEIRCGTGVVNYGI
jgi:hypothetical protein